MKIEFYTKIIIRNIIRIFRGHGSFRLTKRKSNGKAVHVIVNGPSLNDTVHFTNKLPGDIIMVNYAPTTDLFFELKPRILCFADPDFFDDQTKAEEVFGNIEKAGCNSIIVFSDFLVKKYKRKSDTIEVQGVNVIATDKECEGKLKYWMYKKNYLMPPCVNVATMALYTAIQFGYETIYLHGSDFSYMECLKVDEKNNLLFRDEHYYGTVEVNLTLVEGVNMRKQMRALYFAMVGFDEISKYAKFQNVKIYNMCKSSMIDVFDKYGEDDEKRH